MQKKLEIEDIQLKLDRVKPSANRIYIDGDLADEGDPMKDGHVITELEPVLLMTTKGKLQKSGKSVNVQCRWVCVGGTYYYVCK